MPRYPVQDAIPSLPERLRVARRKLGLSQAAAGRRVGVGSLTVLRWEGGRAQPKSAYTCARVLELLAEAEQGQAYVLKDHGGADRVSDVVSEYRPHTSPVPHEVAVRLADTLAAQVSALVRAAVLDALDPQVSRRKRQPRRT